MTRKQSPMMAARFAGALILGGCVSCAGLATGLAYAQPAPDATPAQSTPSPAIIPPAIHPAIPAPTTPAQPPAAAVPDALAPHPPQSRSQRAQDRDSGSGPPADGATADNNATAGEGRYTFLRSGEGFMRLDNRNGEVAFCSKRAVGWACQMLPEDRAALESEIARLQRQNAGLKKELMTRGIALPNNTEPVTPPPVAQNDRIPKMPSDADVARMKSMVGDMWQRLVEMIARLQADALKKS